MTELVCLRCWAVNPFVKSDDDTVTPCRICGHLYAKYLAR